MQLVVEISEDTFFDLKKKQNRTEVDNAILNGTPLPLIEDADNCDSQYAINVKNQWNTVFKEGGTE